MVPPESDDNLRLEIGHVLFIDIVGYSKLLNEEQKERLNQLSEIVLATTPVREATDEQLVRLPTGDGMALVFRDSAEEPARCALEIAEALQKHPELPVRMGIHSGPVSEVTDVSGRTNIAGAGINMAQRVMDCGDAANEYFSDGMSEEFISSLSRLQDLKVVGRTSSFQFKGKTDDSKTIGEKLGVYYLLEGSVRKSADRVRIAVALIKSGDGANVWSDTYDRDLKDIFAVQSEIAGAVAKQLKVALLGHSGQVAHLATASTPSNQNVEAYNALLQGNFYFNRRSVEDFRKAIGYYEEAIRLDPRYALAYAKLSIAAMSLVGVSVSPATKEGQEAIAKA